MDHPFHRAKLKSECYDIRSLLDSPTSVAATRRLMRRHSYTVSIIQMLYLYDFQALIVSHPLIKIITIE